MIWILIVLCCLVTFVFSGIEAGILSVNRVRLAHHGNLGAQGVPPSGRRQRQRR